MDRSIAFVLLALALPGAAFAQASSQSSATPATPMQVEETIQITATRIPEDVLDIPASVTVVTASEMAARGATDLASALSLAAGVAIAPGGDGGPASSVPELMGLREFDAFLLVVDGVPWGGAFNPALSTLDLTNVDRIEILRGAAPVLYGATSFVGVIHVIHRSPEDTPREVALSGGSFGSFRGAVTSALPGGSWKQSISASFEEQGFKDDRAGFHRAHALWSANGSVGAGTLRLALDLTAVAQDPNSPHPRQGSTLTSLVPLDANHNPSDAKIDEDRFHLVAGYERPAGAATWSSTLALTRTTRDTIRGFLREEFETGPGENNADGYRQDFEGNDYYFDTHFAWQRDEALSLVAGVDLLGGKGEAMSENFEYLVALDGSNAPSSRGQRIDERPELEDERTFAGGYVQALWKPAERWTVDAGVRLNSTREKQEGEVETEDGEEKAVDERTETRLSGGFGASFLAWHDDNGGVWVYADYKDAFKPAAIDFGPEAEGEILKPETAQTIEAGLKGSHGGGRFNWQASASRMDFENLVIARTVNGRPSLENAGEQRFEGVEVEGKYRLSEALILQGSYAHHSAEFRDFVQEFDGVPTQLRGHTLELSPDQLGALGLTWAPERGLVGWGSVNYIGERFLNKRNTAVAGSYTTVAAGIGYRFERGEVRLDGFNLTDERDPVAESELGESQYYRLPARFLRASLTWRF
jgi:iron complex outermembrane receptor protein